MRIRSTILALSALAAVLLSSAEVRAWGAAHVGYTHVGPAGVQHYGATAVNTPYRTGAAVSGPGGAAAAGTVHSGPYAGQKYFYTSPNSIPSYGGVGVGGTAYAAGVYRRY